MGKRNGIDRENRDIGTEGIPGTGRSLHETDNQTEILTQPRYRPTDVLETDRRMDMQTDTLDTQRANRDRQKERPVKHRHRDRASHRQKNQAVRKSVLIRSKRSFFSANGSIWSPELSIT